MSEPEKKSKPRLTKFQKNLELAQILSYWRQNPLVFNHPPFPLDLALVQEGGDKNHITILQMNPLRKICSVVSPDHVANELVAYIVKYDHTITVNEIPIEIDTSEALDAVRFWMAVDPKLGDHPPRVAFEDDLCQATPDDSFDFAYNRAPFLRRTIAQQSERYLTLLEEGEECFPTDLCKDWEEMRQRVTNFDALLAWIWSLFEKDSDISQYLYLYGNGNDGKSVLASVLGKLLGSAYLTATQLDIENRFFLPNILGKRVCYISEASPKFPMSGRFKALTGERAILCEIKGQQHFQSTHNCKFLFASNNKLDLSHSRADQRRVIYCEFETFEGKPKRADVIVRDLYCQLMHLLPYMRAKYMQLTSDGTIKTDRSQAEALADEHDEEALMVFDSHFEADPKYYTSASYVALRIRADYSNQKMHDFKEAWRRHKKVHYIIKKVASKTIRYYFGMKPINGDPRSSDWGRVETLKGANLELLEL